MDAICNGTYQKTRKLRSRFEATTCQSQERVQYVKERIRGLLQRYSQIRQESTNPMQKNPQKQPSHSKLDFGNTPLIRACKNGLEKVALELLKHPDKCKIDQADKYGNTALIWACDKGMNKVALELLKHPDKCKIDQAGKYGNTALMLACVKGMTDVALELLKYPSECKMDQVNTYGNIALILACFKGMKEVALELLKYPDECNMDYYEEKEIGICYTALELLKYPDKCKLGHIDDRGNTALIQACCEGTNEVALKLLRKYPNECKIDHINRAKKTALSYARKNNMTSVVSILEMHVKKESNDAIEKVQNSAKKGECLMCCEETNNNIFLTECKHVLCVCCECSGKIDKKCPICRTSTNIITGCFVV